MKLSVIIVNYNVRYFLENCLNSVFKASKEIDIEVIVVDNNSVDSSIRMIEEKFPEVQLIINQENVGFSKANNQALKIAKGNYVLLLNPDTVVEENTFSKCIDYFENHPNVGGIGVKMFDGKGVFLPESKRGLPTPKVAFYKISGLSSIFPKSKIFGRYHLGYLPNDESHEVEILSGAFMMIRRKALNEIGYLDEEFFMYGEDIDLSYRIIKAGYKNVYLSDTSIIHYKGESTKKSSINYVFVFYRAMAIFAKKHFSEKNAQLFSILINIAIFLRASIAVINRTIRQFVLPIIDAIVLFFTFYFIKHYYEQNIKFPEGGAYPEEVETYGIPIMTLIFVFTFFINGAYSIPTKASKIFRALFAGSLLLIIVYSLLDEGYRFSRAIILFSSVWSFISIPATRWILHLFNFRPFQKKEDQRIVLVGHKAEIERIKSFLKKTVIEPKLILAISSNENSEHPEYFDGKLYQLKDIIEIYQINEVVFCAKDISSTDIIKQMALLSKKELDFKIAPSESLYIIGSNSIEHSGEFYLIETNALLSRTNLRKKRMLDLFVAIILLIASPVLMWFSGSVKYFFIHIFQCLLNKRSFVGISQIDAFAHAQLNLNKGIFSPVDLFDKSELTEDQIEQINLEYSRNYHIFKDLEIILKNIHHLGRNSSN